MRVQNEQARAFYEIEAAREAWSVRELERQIAVLLFERLAANRNPDEVRALAREGQQVSSRIAPRPEQAKQLATHRDRIGRVHAGICQEILADPRWRLASHAHKIHTL